MCIPDAPLSPSGRTSVTNERNTGPVSAAVDSAVALRQGQRLRVRGWVLRVSVAVVLVTVAFLAGAERATWVGYGIAFVWAPLVGIVDAWARRQPEQLEPRVAALLVDGLMVVGAWLLAPEIAALIVLAQVPLVLYHAYHAHRVLVVLAAALSLGLATITFVHPDLAANVEATVLLVYTLLIAGGLWLQQEGGYERRMSAGQLSAVAGRTEAVLAGIGDAVVVTGPAGRIRQFSQAAQQTFGCPDDAAVGHACHQILELRDDLVELDCSGGCPLIGLDGSAGERELWRPLATGVRQPLLASARAVRDREGRIEEVVHSFRDITSVKLADEAKTLFLATASHELKTPITVIRGFAELLAARPELSDEQRRVALQTIEARSIELNHIVDRLLLTARIDAGKIDIQLEELDLVPIVQSRIGDVAGATTRTIDLALPDGPVPPVSAASGPVATVLEHLLENALKYSPGGEPVHVTVATTADAVELAVADRGVGMTPAQQAQCFERFWQAEPSDVRRFGGSGIGLYLVRSLVRGMHGDVWVDSTPGQGSTFTVALRRADVVSTESAEQAPASVGERTIIEEFMRQVGVGPAPAGRAPTSDGSDT